MYMQWHHNFSLKNSVALLIFWIKEKLDLSTVMKIVIFVT